LAVDVKNLLKNTIELLELLLEFFELWVALVEVFEGFIGAFLPEPRVLLKAGKELVNLVFGALNRTSQEKNHLDNFFVFGNPVVEGLTLILGLVLLIPVLHLLGGFENVGSRTINRGLDFLE